MKKYFYKKLILIGVLLVFIVPSCTDLDEEIFSNLTEEEFFNSLSPDAIDASKASAYTTIVGNWGGHNSLWSLNEVSSDEMAITQKGPDWEDGQQWIRVHRHEYNESEQSVNNGWNYCFGAVSTVNRLIGQFEGNDIIVDELRAVRAMVYYWLIDNYGNVPIVDETVTSPTPETKSRAEVFAFIEDEMNAVLPNLSQDRTYATMNYWVAKAVLAKLYLNAEVYIGTARWADAAAACAEIIDSGLYSLESDFFDNFSTANEGSSENIFVIPYDEVNAGGFNLGQMTLHYASQATFDLKQQPWNGYSSLQEFYNSFDADDARIGSFLEGPQFASDGTTRLMDASAEAGDPDGEPLTFTPEINELFPGALRQAGVRVGKWQYANGADGSLSNDFAIFRLADIMLMRAEALWRQNPGDAMALDLVNEIRTRAGVDEFASLTADNLLAERGREMFAESYRRQDLIRFGKFNDAWWEKPASNVQKNIFPIPKPQIDVNPSLQQNPGY